MRYKESSSYIQRQINKILRLIRDFAKTYIDNIIVFLKTLS